MEKSRDFTLNPRKRASTQLPLDLLLLLFSNLMFSLLFSRIFVRDRWIVFLFVYPKTRKRISKNNGRLETHCSGISFGAFEKRFILYSTRSDYGPSRDRRPWDFPAGGTSGEAGRTVITIFFLLWGWGYRVWTKRNPMKTVRYHVGFRTHKLRSSRFPTLSGWAYAPPLSI